MRRKNRRRVHLAGEVLPSVSGALLPCQAFAYVRETHGPMLSRPVPDQPEDRSYADDASKHLHAEIIVPANNNRQDKRALSRFS